MIARCVRTATGYGLAVALGVGAILLTDRVWKAAVLTALAYALVCWFVFVDEPR